IDGAVDEDRQIGIDLNQTAVAALIPVVSAPRLVVHVLDGEALAVRQRHVRERARAATLDRLPEYGFELLARDDELLPIGFVALRDRAAARQRRVEITQQRLKVLLGMVRRDRVVERFRFLVERELPALEDF